MNELKIFNNKEFGQVRTLEIENKTYFVGIDVARILGYKNPNDAISRHCKGYVKRAVPTNSGVQQMNVVTEGDIYRLTAKSELPGAEKFESWIFDEVLPSIRKHGMYQTPKLSKELQAIFTLDARTVELNKRIDNLEDTMTIDHGQAVNIKHAVDIAVKRLCFGSETAAYKSKDLKRKIYQYAWRNFKDYFNITAYHNLLRKDMETALGYIQSLILQGSLLREVQSTNNQMSF